MHFQEDSALVSERNKPPREYFVVKVNSTYIKAYRTMKIYAGPLLASGWPAVFCSDKSFYNFWPKELECLLVLPKKI